MKKLLIACGLFILTACGANLGQQILTAQANVVMRAQPARFDLYESEHARCLEGAEEFQEYHDCMGPSRHVARAVDSYGFSLRSAQAAYTAAGMDGFQAMLPCLVVAAGDLVDALEVANVPIPDEVLEVAAMATVIEGECR